MGPNNSADVLPRSNDTVFFEPHQNNTSYGPHIPALVTFSSYTGILVLIISVIFDLLIVIAFLRRPRLVTPFTIQYLNSVILQLCLMLFDGPLNIVAHLNTKLLYDPLVCAVFKFGAWTFPSLAWLQQMVIVIDRWSALLAPMWYRVKTVRYGVNVTLSVVMYYMVLYIPLFVADTVSGVPPNVRCENHHAWEKYQLFVRIATYYLPLCFTYLSYPVLLIVMRNRREAQIHAAVLRTNFLERTTHHPRSPTKQATYTRRNGFSVSRVPEAQSELPSAVLTHGAPQKTAKVTGGLSRLRRRNLNLAMWMMFVQIVCCLPWAVTYSLVLMDIKLKYLNEINTLAILLQAVNFMVDPLMYWYFFQDLRDETLSIIRCRS